MADPQLSPADTHQAVQATLSARMVSVLDQVWGLLDPSDLEGSLPRFVAALTAILTRYGAASAAAADTFYQSQRIRAGVNGRMPRPRAEVVPEVAVDQVVVDSVATAIGSGAAAGERALDSEAEQLVLDQSRRLIMSTAQLDRAARGWARVVEPGACSFCLMLAMRGAVYKSKATGNFRAHTRRPDGSGGDCRCHAEPVFGFWEPQASVRDAKKLWDQVTQGRSGHDARVAFRQALEGREVTGAKKKRSTYAALKPGRERKYEEAQLRVLTALPPAKTPEAATWRADRIADIRRFLGEN